MYGKKPCAEAQTHTQRRNYRTFMTEEIDPKSHTMEIQLLLLALGTGIQDAVVYPQYGCFVSNQTGNTVVFAVALLSRTSSTVSSICVPAIAVSLCVFIAGIFFTGQLANYFRAVQRRWWLLATSILQSFLLAISATLLYIFPEAAQGTTTLGLATIALLAFSAGAQVGMVRALKITDITTAMATAAYVDVLTDRRLFAPVMGNRGRNRRLGFLVALVGGSFIGAGIHSTAGSGAAVVVSLVVRLVATGVCTVSGKVVPEKEISGV